jgi:hypothetical protein
LEITPEVLLCAGEQNRDLLRRVESPDGEVLPTWTNLDTLHRPGPWTALSSATPAGGCPSSTRRFSGEGPQRKGSLAERLFLHRQPERTQGEGLDLFGDGRQDHPEAGVPWFARKLNDLLLRLPDDENGKPT